MKIFTDIQNVLSFYINISQHFFGNALQCLLKTVVLKIFSQILMLAAFLVPIKVIFTLAIGEFNPITIMYIHYSINSKEHLALLLMFVVVAITLMSFFVDKILLKKNNVCLKKVLLTNNKMNIYNKQNELEEKIYLQYINGLSNLIFFLISSIFILVLSPIVLISFLMYIFILILIIFFLYEKITKLQKLIEKKFLDTVNKIFMFGFLIVFMVLVYEVMYDIKPFQAILLVISFILLRRSVDGLNTFFQSLVFLTKRKKQVINIFLDKDRHKVLDDFEISNNSSQNFLEIEAIFKKIIKKEYKNIQINRFDFEVSNEKAYEIKIDSNSSGEIFILKIFDENAEIKAKNEYFLLTSLQKTSFMPYLVGKTIFKSYHCHLFKMENNFRLIKKEEFKIHKHQLENYLIAMELPKGMVRKYLSTHKLIHEKILLNIQNNFFPISEKEQRVVDAFVKNTNLIANIVRTLPLRLQLNGVTFKNSVLVENQLVLMSIGKWAIEPMGYGYEEKELSDLTIDDEHHQAISLIVLLKQCETHLNQQNFYKLIEDLSKIEYLIETK